MEPRLEQRCETSPLNFWVGFADEGKQDLALYLWQGVGDNLKEIELARFPTSTDKEEVRKMIAQYVKDTIPKEPAFQRGYRCQAKGEVVDEDLSFLLYGNAGDLAYK
jgi:hypothetical protein|tara:strand:+ start:139 stop:459 length:321 start_codon:yes stop_codon:yes gene_type:complete